MPHRRIEFASVAPSVDKLEVVGESNYENDDDDDQDNVAIAPSVGLGTSNGVGVPLSLRIGVGVDAQDSLPSAGTKKATLSSLTQRSAHSFSRPPLSASASANVGSGGTAFGRWLTRRNKLGSSPYFRDDDEDYENQERKAFSRGLGHLDGDDSGPGSPEGEDEYEMTAAGSHRRPHGHVISRAAQSIENNPILRSVSHGSNGAPDDPNAASDAAGNAASAPKIAYDVRAYSRVTSSGHASGTASSDDSATETDSEEEDVQETDSRYEWQHMLSNVLQGDVLKNEKTRIAGTLANDLDDSTNSRKWRAYQVWLRVRAKMRGTSVQQETDYLEEARGQIEGIWNEVAEFRIVDVEQQQAEEKEQSVVDGDPESSEQAVASTAPPSVTDEDDIPPVHLPPSDAAQKPPDAEEQVEMIIRKVEWCECLYPSIRALKAEKLYAAESRTMTRIDALVGWQTILHRLKTQIGILQRWTGSANLEVTQPGHEVIEEAATPPTHLSTAVVQPVHRLVDASPFVERIFKEGGLQKTFEKNTIVDLYRLIHDAKSVMIACREQYTEMNIPTFYNELIALVHFPTDLIREALKVRLQSVQNLSFEQQLSPVLVDQLTVDFREGLALAAQVKENFLEIMNPNSSQGWPGGTLNEEYDRVLLDSLRFFFKLLTWQLRTGNKATFLKETEIVEQEWSFLSESVEQIEGGDLLVGEHFCMLTHRLLQRVAVYFEERLRVLEERTMPAIDIARWFNQTLDNVRLRHRKLLRFGRVMQQRFENAAEYVLDDVNLNAFIHALSESQHFLVYTGSLESQAIYVIASEHLKDRQDLLRQILLKCYAQDTQADLIDPDGPGEEPHYILLCSPSEPFIWTGAVLSIDDIATPEFDLREGRVRLVAGGTDRRLQACKQVFCELFPVFREQIVVESKAHLGRINKELKKIKRSEFKFAESILGSVDRIHHVLKGVADGQAILAQHFLFTADLGQRSLKNMEPVSRSKFSMYLMQFSIKWVAFICDDCNPSDSRTFKWAVGALEFALLMTRNENILRFSSLEFELLRSKVASCMTLLISHFDILGARSSFQAKQEKDRLDVVKAEIRRHLKNTLEYLNDVSHLRDRGGMQTFPGSLDSGLLFDHQSILDGLTDIRKRWLAATMAAEQKRIEIDSGMRVIGRVLDEERPEDKSLLFLAGSNSSISIRWQQGKFIGAGTFGSVYLAVNLDSGSLMAVKEIKFQDLTSAPNLIKQIRDEMQVMELLQHPNIVEYYGIEVHRDKVYIFEEYCQGGSLADLISHGRIEDESVVQIYTFQMLDGLLYLHNMGVVHRDIKPDNILLDHMGVIKFVDFGAAKILAKNQKTLAARTRAPGPNGEVNSLTGTPMYMSPEVIKGDQKGRRGAMDIWSLGCVILECATGHRPWSNLDNEWAIMFHIGIATKHPPLPEKGELSDLGIDFIEACLNIDPVERPSAQELMEHPWIVTLSETFAAELQRPSDRSIETVAEEEEPEE